jgi:hypothetical protein
MTTRAQDNNLYVSEEREPSTDASDRADFWTDASSLGTRPCGSATCSAINEEHGVGSG